MRIPLLFMLTAVLYSSESTWVYLQYLNLSKANEKSSGSRWYYGKIDNEAYEKLKNGSFQGPMVYLTETCWIEWDKESGDGKVMSYANDRVKSEVMIPLTCILKISPLNGSPEEIIEKRKAKSNDQDKNTNLNTTGEEM